MLTLRVFIRELELGWEEQARRKRGRAVVGGEAASFEPFPCHHSPLCLLSRRETTRGESGPYPSACFTPFHLDYVASAPESFCLERTARQGNRPQLHAGFSIYRDTLIISLIPHGVKRRRLSASGAEHLSKLYAIFEMQLTSSYSQFQP